MTLAYRAGTPLDGSAPCLLYGYGAYESCEDPAFGLSLPSLLDRGVVYAIAHVRGGGERGRVWWHLGRLQAKPNTFTDFIAVADWLARDTTGSRPLIDGRRIVSRGLSAGGLLQGAVYSMAPGRWRAVVAEVPFVDCVNTMLDPGIPLTINEWDEWGDPRDPGDFACLLSYAPYENPPPGRADLLVTGAVNDPRVLVHEPRMGGPAARHRHRGRQAAVPGRARGRCPHRPVRALRPAALRGGGQRVHPGRDGPRRARETLAARAPPDRRRAASAGRAGQWAAR